MEVPNIINFAISILSITICIATFVRNGNKDTKTDASKDAYKWGKLDAKLSNLEKQVDKILDKLDTFEVEIDTKIQKEMKNHIKQYHEHHDV